MLVEVRHFQEGPEVGDRELDHGQVAGVVEHLNHLVALHELLLGLVGGCYDLVYGIDQVRIAILDVVLQDLRGVLSLGLRHRVGLLVYLCESALLQIRTHLVDNDPSLILYLFKIRQPPLDTVLLVLDLVLNLYVFRLIVDQLPANEDLFHLLEVPWVLLIDVIVTICYHSSKYGVYTLANIVFKKLII